MVCWQIFSAIALRRLPEVVPRMDPIEMRVQNIFSAYEVARSRLSDHELKHLEDVRLKESQDRDVLIKETAQDKEDIWAKEKAGFQYPDYDDRLTYTEYLFLKQKFGSDLNEQWLLPQAEFDSKQDGNLLDTARRALKESLGIVNGYRIVSKIPSSVYSFRYPKKISNSLGFGGAKVFFLKAHLDLPSPSVKEAVDGAKNTNLRWLTKDEAFNSVHKRYMTSFSQGLLHEDRVDTNRVLRRALGYANAIRAQQGIMLRK